MRGAEQTTAAHGPRRGDTPPESNGVRRAGAAILLAGGPKPCELIAESGRSVLDLSVDGRDSLLEVWVRRLGGLLSDGAAVRVVYCGKTPRPADPTIGGPPDSPPVVIERESHAYRGPAGIVRDVFEDLPADADIVVGEGARYVCCRIEGLLTRHAERGAAITVAVNPDDSPAGVYVLKRSTLDLVPRAGFMDLKEQWLRRAVDEGLSVHVCRLPDPGVASIRTRPALLRAALSDVGGGRHVFRAGVIPGPLNVISPDAQVASDALVADSVVMRGAVIGPGAIVARSIVCPDAVVEPGAEAIDATVTGRLGGSGRVRTDELIRGRR